MNLSQLTSLQGGQDDNLLFNQYLECVSNFERDVLRRIKNAGNQNA